MSDGFSTVALGLCGAVFADRTELWMPRYAFLVTTEWPGPLTSDLGLLQQVEHGPDVMREADLILVFPIGDGLPGPEVIDAIRDAHRRGATVASFCSGAFVLAETGLLDGRRATTHPRLAAELARRYPRVHVEPDALYVDEGRLVTGVGGAEGINMVMHLVRREHGTAVANAIAQETVAVPNWSGDRPRYLSFPTAARSEDERITAVLEWAGDHLDQPHSIDDLAARALMSTRTFNRRFKAATGTTPHAWLRAQRVRRAGELLETTGLGVEEIARQVGYRTAAVLRENFIKTRGVSPQAYRRALGHRLTLSRTT
ncbi:GlxA family transcriptional regulator [Actinomadura pelletieri]|uniref:GlxA family transcriptional regulator n=1 Tax=Actinomadura pelletieri TaxID=111805 RepID=UPI001B85D85F|nr:helix-turn-helix domain-containing protein [Actinomadura pelletieri]